MKSKKIMFLFSILMVISLVLMACSSTNTPVDSTTQEETQSSDSKETTEKTSTEEPITITVYTNVIEEQAKVIEEITDDFMKKNPNIKVDFSTLGRDYENVMKVNMASNEMPDVFSTHGWAKIRYGNFLEDLRNESWVSQIKDSMKPIVTDEEGKVYVLPLDEDKTGPIYNVDILNEYGVDIPKTYDELIKACEVIKEKSNGEIIPIHIGAADEWPLGNYYDYFSTPLLISAKESYGDQLIDGSFDWSNYDKISELLLTLQNKELINKDILTAKYTDSVDAFASGKVAFALTYGPYIAQEAMKKNADLNYGMMPIPSIIEGDTPTFVGGERTTFGIWKDSKNKDAAKKYLEFLAKKENVTKVAESNGIPAGFKNVEVDCGNLTKYYEEYKDVRVFPYFDRVYLPNGMWNVMCKNGQDLLAGAITPSEYSKNMEKEYNRLRQK